MIFTSNATNLVGGDTNGSRDVFVRDRQTGTTTRASVNSSGVEANLGASDASVSGNGRFVSFSSNSSNLMLEDSLGFKHVYVHDRQTGATTLGSVASDGNQMIGSSEMSVLSADGRYVAFQFDDKGDSMPVFVIEVHDRFTGMTSTVVGRYSFSEAWSGTPSMSADGRRIVFSSGGSLVSNDTNGVTDVYLKEMAYPQDLAPTVSSVNAPFDGYPTPASVIFRVTFSEIVAGVTVDDFTLTTTGNILGASVTGVSGSANEYGITVNTGSGDGTLRLDVLDNDSITDIALNPLGGIGPGNGNFTSGEIYVVDKNIPSVLGVTRLDSNPSTGQFVHFAITFSEDVSGVDVLDFAAFPSGSVNGSSVVEVNGSGRNYVARVSTGSGEGTLKLNVVDNDSIRDGNNHSIGGDGPDNGTFTAGEAYTIERIPSVLSILRLDPNPSSADTVNFKVTFTEAVVGVDSSDFVPVTTGDLAGASIVSVSSPGPAIEFNIAVSTTSGSGSLRLDLIDNDSILDGASNPLGGAGVGNGNYISGDVYTISRVTRSVTSVYFRSNGTNDGWVLESSEEGNQGGLTNSQSPFLLIGDDVQDRQIRSILHFPTQYLPDNAVVTQAILAIKLLGVSGTDPFMTHGNISIDFQSGYFGSQGIFGFGSLDPTDFQSPGNLNSAGIIMNNPIGGWYWGLLNSPAYPIINLQGPTQVRLRFELEDNDDLGEDLLVFSSGNNDLLSERPRLIVEYYLQR